MCHRKHLPLKISNTTANEARHGEEMPHKRRTTKFIRSARTKRILERLREAFGDNEIAGEEKLTERRVRQIPRRSPGRPRGAIHAHLRIARLGRAAPVAGEALSRGDIRAVAPFIVAAAHQPLGDMGGLVRRKNRVPSPPGGGGSAISAVSP